MARIRKGYADTPHGQVHYRATERRPAGPIVFLHQTASASEMYEALLNELADSFWCVALDTPGFGESFHPTESPTITFYALVLFDALRSLGISECYLFGHHTGAAIAAQMTHAHPGFARKLILSGPPLLNPAQIEMLKSGLRPFEIQPDGEYLLAVWNRLRKRDPDAPLALTHRETLLTLQAGEAAAHTYHAVFAHDFAGQLAALDIPVLVMAGEHDTLRASLEPAYALLHNGQMRLIPNAGTYICDREPKLVADVVREFIGG
jgi:pimeloyl-ACP methyl ester carboxylesterase